MMLRWLGRALGVLAFLDLFHDLFEKASRSPGRLAGGCFAPLEDAGFDQEPGRMADGGDNLLLIVKRLDQFQRVLIDPQRPAKDRD